MGQHLTVNIKKVFTPSTKEEKLQNLLLDLQARSVEEYPWLASGSFQSCTITDNTIPDNPIIWVNDDFERNRFKSPFFFFLLLLLRSFFFLFEILKKKQILIKLFYK